MSKSTRRKDREGNGGEFSRNHYIDGTAARTRPFPCDEIMRLRRSKNCSEDNDVVSLEPEIKSGKDVLESFSVRLESGKHRATSSAKHDLEGVLKKEDKGPVKESKSVKAEDRDGRNSEKKSKATLYKGNSGNKSNGGKRGTEDHGKKEYDNRSSDDPRKSHRKVSSPKDRYADSSRGDIEKASRRKIPQDEVGKSRENTVKEKANRRNIPQDEVGKSRENADKNHEARKWSETEISKRKERDEASKHTHDNSREKRRRSRSREHNKDKSRRSVSPALRMHKESREHDEEYKSKRRRSRSRDLDKDKSRRSMSPSVRVHKQSTRHGEDSRSKIRRSRSKERGELPLYSSKHMSGRLDSSIDRKNISTNGSSNNSKRHVTSPSRLGGYSPRKRRTEAAVKTPSPTSRSPEKKSLGWDFPPVGAESKIPGSVLSVMDPLNQTLPSKTPDISPVVPATSLAPNPFAGVVPRVQYFKNSASIDSIQLTQATRPSRSLYVENLPSSASEAAVMECLNNYLLSTGVNHIQGRQPCISCIVHKEKGQAVVEFLTPEDASSALSFDGKSFLGSILKVRRPRDYVEVTTGVNEKPSVAADIVRGIVEDSPCKIFVGGISKVISADMLMEIVGTFGPLKAYYFGINENLGEPCAFLEYVDQSVTLKACAGLNGMKLGGQVLTVVQAFPDESSVENHGNPPFYGIPEHASPLLEEPTQVLKLKNVLDPNSLAELSDPELEEILEDIRLECARFGMVKSINVLKHTDSSRSSEACEVTENVVLSVDEGEPAEENLDSSEPSNHGKELQETEGNGSHDDKVDLLELAGCTRKTEELDAFVEAKLDDRIDDNVVKYEISDSIMVDQVIDQTSQEPNHPVDHVYSLDKKLTDLSGDLQIENKLLVQLNIKMEDDDENLKMASSELDNSTRAEVETADMSQPWDLQMENKSLVELNIKMEEDDENLKMSSSELDNSTRAEVETADMSQPGDLQMENKSLVELNMKMEEDDENLKMASSELDNSTRAEVETAVMSQTGDREMENKSSCEVDMKLEEEHENLKTDSSELGGGSKRTGMETAVNGDCKEQESANKDIFEPGGVFVEFKRTEASSVAAHCLHRRLFDGRIVTVSYVPHDLYCLRFLK